MLEALIPSRSVEDYADGRVPVVLAGVTYRLRELPMVATDEWASAIDLRLVGLLQKIDDLDSGKVTLATLFEDARLFDGTLFETLLAYDQDDVLPAAEELRATCTHTQILFALLGVWATTKSPLAVGVMNAVRLALILTGSAPVLTATSPESSAADSGKSDDEPPTGSSITISPSSPSGAPTSIAPGSKRKSKPSASATSRPATPRHSAHGSDTPAATGIAAAPPGRRSSRP